MCISPHVGLPQPTCKALPWRAPRDDGRQRVVQWTCDCQEIVYELREAAGQGFVRRYVRAGKGWRVSDTFRMRTGEAHEVWQALLSGHAP